MLTIDSFENWLSDYKDCWEQGDSDRLVKLFTSDAEYHEAPFEPPMVGTEAIRAYWQEGAEYGQKNVTVQFNRACVIGNRGLVHWNAKFERVPDSVKVELDGFLELDFTDSGLCRILREWWHRREV